MKRLFIRLLTFCVLCISFIAILAQTAFAADPVFWENSRGRSQFCFQNFNAYGPLYASQRYARTQGLLGYLKDSEKCEIVQLQEVWMTSHINHIEDSLAGSYNFANPNRDHRIGIMSLVDGEILSEDTYTFAVNNSGSILDRARSLAHVQKAFHALRAKLPGIDEELYLVNTHLHPTSEAVRLTQILDLLKWRLKNQDRKLLMSGDFNAEIKSLERELLMNVLGMRDAMEESFGKKGYPQDFCTYCHSNPLRWLSGNHTFDYIFYSNVGQARTQLKVKGGEVNLKGSPRQPLSDHFGIRVQFSVQEAAPVPHQTDPVKKEKALRTLVKALKVFKAQKNRVYRPYEDWVQNIINQLSKSNKPTLAQAL